METVLFDLPLIDIFPLISKWLSLEDLLEFRKCSTRCREVVDKTLKNWKILYLQNPNSCDDSWTEEKDTEKYTLRCSEDFQVILTNCRKLHTISIQNIRWITDQMIHELVRNNPELETLEIATTDSETTRETLDLFLNSPSVSRVYTRVYKKNPKKRRIN